MSEEDRRLTDFVPDDGGITDDEDDITDDGGITDDEDGTTPESDDGDISDQTVAPAVSTADWRDGGGCDGCGAVVDRRWRDGDALVCGDCKEW